METIDAEALLLTGRYTLEDWRAYQKACAQRLRAPDRPRNQWVRIVAFVLAGFATAWLFDEVSVAVHVPSLLAGIALVILAVWLVSRRTRQNAVPQPHGSFLREHAYELSQDGITSRAEGAHSFSSWSRVQTITQDGDHMFLWLDRLHAYVIPLRFLPEGVSRELLHQRIVHWIGPRLQENRTQAQPSAPVAGTPHHKPWVSVIPRLLSLRSRYDAPAPPGPLTLAALWMLTFAVWLFVGWRAAQPDPTFVIYGLPTAAWYVLGILLFAVAVARSCERRLGFGHALGMALVVAPPAILLAHVISTYLDGAWLAVALLTVVAYLVAYLARGLQTLTGRSQSRAVAAGLITATAVAWLTSLLYVQPTVWVNEDAGASDHYDESWDRAEPLLFAQPARIDAALQAIAAGDGGPQTYFVGFAGYGEQRVFAEEIRLAQNVVAGRFAVDGRSMLLLNDQRDLDGAPLASPTALRYALRGLAARMNVEQDVLFLSLSSHGSEDWALAVSNGALPLHELSATELAQMLDESGIKWRIIVISACYAGGFIDELRDAHSIVIAAAAPDRTSFGCSDERDLTYFGEAFYRDALPGASTLRHAFQQARASIAERERAEGMTASEPQAHFGMEIERKVAAMMANTARRAASR